MKTRLYCHHFVAIGFPNKCCLSCHEDYDEFGYEMTFLEPEGRSKVDAYVCCGIAHAIEDSDTPLRIIFARALLAHRKESQRQ